MQGLDEFIPTAKKISYINQLLRVGFDTIDFGSFVSPKAIPQLRDTAEVLDGRRDHLPDRRRGARARQLSPPDTSCAVPASRS